MQAARARHVESAEQRKRETAERATGQLERKARLAEERRREQALMHAAAVVAEALSAIDASTTDRVFRKEGLGVLAEIRPNDGGGINGSGSMLFGIPNLLKDRARRRAASEHGIRAWSLQYKTARRGRILLTAEGDLVETGEGVLMDVDGTPVYLTSEVPLAEVVSDDRYHDAVYDRLADLVVRFDLQVTL